MIQNLCDAIHTVIESGHDRTRIFICTVPSLYSVYLIVHTDFNRGCYIHAVIHGEHIRSRSPNSTIKARFTEKEVWMMSAAVPHKHCCTIKALLQKRHAVS